MLYLWIISFSFKVNNDGGHIVTTGSNWGVWCKKGVKEALGCFGKKRKSNWLITKLLVDEIKQVCVVQGLEDSITSHQNEPMYKYI